MIARRFDTVIFDLDGTLVDTAPDLCAALNHVLEAQGHPPLDVHAIRDVAGEGARAILERGFGVSEGVPRSSMERLTDPFLRYYEANISNRSTATQGLQQNLSILMAAGVRLGVCTNKPEALAKKLLRELRLAPYFASIVGGDTTPFRKPDPRPLRQCVVECGGGRPCFVGDSIVDAMTAKSADIPFVAFTATSDSKGIGTSEYSAQINCIGELVDIVVERTMSSSPGYR